MPGAVTIAVVPPVRPVCPPPKELPPVEVLPPVNELPVELFPPEEEVPPLKALPPENEVPPLEEEEVLLLPKAPAGRELLVPDDEEDDVVEVVDCAVTVATHAKRAIPISKHFVDSAFIRISPSIRADYPAFDIGNRDQRTESVPRKS